ncbi:hypothetical protein GQ54DRAFT_299340 [Martensiomyces pterosporus]|nr:hypothetical protein GQ54DRAFT_299340 [Martensiomyces pterosporus]
MALPRKATGIPDFCNYPVVPSTHAYIVIIFCTALWVYFCGVVGAISITMTAIHIIRTTRVTKNMTQLSRATYGLSREPKRRGSTEILNTTLVAIVWFPITPIISLWLNMILISVHYYKKRVYMWTEYVNVALLALQSILMAVALVVNPSVRGVFRERRRKIRMGKQALTGVTRGSRLSHELYNVASSNATTMSSLLGLE